jgi:hypothetical protein
MRRPSSDAGTDKETGTKEGESSLNRLLREIDDLIKQATKSKKKNRSEISRTGEIKGLASKKHRLIYGFSIKLEKRAKK